jgi:hypothetical protein
MLDNAGFRTGYIYRNPLIKGDPPKPKNDIEVPPAVSSLGYLLEEEELYRQGYVKQFFSKKLTFTDVFLYILASGKRVISEKEEIKADGSILPMCTRKSRFWKLVLLTPKR